MSSWKKLMGLVLSLVMMMMVLILISNKKRIRNPLPASDTFNRFIGQIANSVTQAINNMVQRFEYFVLESHRAKLFPDLLYGIHFWCVRRDTEQGDIFWHFQRF